MSGNNITVGFTSGLVDGAMSLIQPPMIGVLVASLSILILFLGFALAVWGQIRPQSYESTVNTVRVKLNAEQSEEPDQGQDPMHLQRVEDRALLQEYHARSLTQSQLSFRFALGAAVFGFAFIMFSVFTVAVGGFDQAGVAGLQLGAGVVVESVAGLFFVLSNQSRRMLGAFFDKLREDRKLDESLRLARELPESSAVRDRLQAALAIQLAGANESVLSAVLNSGASNNDPDRVVRAITEEAS